MPTVCDLNRVRLYRELRECEAAIAACKDLARMGELKARAYVLRLKLGIDDE